MEILFGSDLHMDKEAREAIAKASEKFKYTLVGGDIGLRRDEDPDRIVSYMRDTFHSEITYLTPGNHDFWPVNLVKLHYGPSNIHVVVDQKIPLYDPETNKVYSVWFSPWSTQFCDWNWMRDVSEDHYDIPEDIDFVVTHGPVRGILDKCPGGDNAGSEGLLGAIYRTKAKAVFSGHIHGYDYNHIKCYDIDWYNISVLDEHYRFKGSLPVFDTDTGTMRYLTEKDWS